MASGASERRSPKRLYKSQNESCAGSRVFHGKRSERGPLSILSPIAILSQSCHKYFRNSIAASLAASLAASCQNRSTAPNSRGKATQNNASATLRIFSPKIIRTPDIVQTAMPTSRRGRISCLHLPWLNHAEPKHLPKLGLIWKSSEATWNVHL